MSVNFVGQHKLRSKLAAFTAATLPHAILICGERGSGRHTLCKGLAEQLSLEFVDVAIQLKSETLTTKNYSADALRQFIDDCYSSVAGQLVVLAAEDLTPVESNMVLKFLEEPPENIFIVIIALNENSVLPTTRNRCIKFEMLPYSHDQLKLFFTDEKLYEFVSAAGMLSLFRTPGQVLEANKCGINQLVELQKLANTVVSSIKNASYSNLLVLPDKFFPQESDKLPLDLFLNILQDGALKYCVQSPAPIYMKIYNEVDSLLFDCTKCFVNKRTRFENFLWRVKALWKEVSA